MNTLSRLATRGLYAKYIFLNSIILWCKKPNSVYKIKLVVIIDQ